MQHLPPVLRERLAEDAVRRLVTWRGRSRVRGLDGALYHEDVCDVPPWHGAMATRVAPIEAFNGPQRS